MNFIKPFSEISKTDVAIAGGKGASLGEMTQAGINVPPGYVITAEAFDRFMDETELKEEIIARIAEVEPEDVNSIDRVSNILRDIIHDTPMPADLTAEILQTFDELGAEHVAIRSSATAEDSDIASWAGELDTFLNTDRTNVVERVKHCWSSLFTPRAIFYRFEKNLQDSHVSVAVVVQNMVQSEISGICFTVHPVTEDPNQLIIEAGYGLGEAIVSGQITPDSYIVDKKDRILVDINIGNQTRKLVRAVAGVSTAGQGSESQTMPKAPLKHDDESQNIWVDIASADAGKQKLTGKQIIELAELCMEIEAHYGFPCDIEWAMESGRFFITQSRPITTLKGENQ